MEQPFCPAPAEAPLFDASRNAWVLSRYSDVYAALREPTLLQATSRGKATSPDDSATHARLYAEVQADMSRMSGATWRGEMDNVLRSLLDDVDRGRPFDLVKEIIHPWSVAMMVVLSEAGPAEARQLRWVAGQLFFKKEHPVDSSRIKNILTSFSRRWSSRRLKKAEALLDSMLKNRKSSVSKPMFAGLTQTLPSFLAKAWLALLQHPDQAARLIKNPALMAGATEELLRYAGVVHTLFRQAKADIDIGEISVRSGQQVILKVASANYDSARFDEPECLNVGRRIGIHVGLGAGVHACVGSVLVRMACTAITPIFLSAGPVPDGKLAPVWMGDSTLRWPFAVPVILLKK
jgi:cytochrome P450